jgi:hypothetical protein
VGHERERTVGSGKDVVGTMVIKKHRRGNIRLTRLSSSTGIFGGVLVCKRTMPRYVSVDPFSDDNDNGAMSNKEEGEGAEGE